MKPFNLQEYLDNPSRKVVTRSGRSVRVLCTDAKGDCPVFGLAIGVDGAEFPIMCSAIGETEFEEDDLFFDTVKMNGWVNIYRDEDGFRILGSLLETEEHAIFEINEKNDKYKYIATIKLTWEEEA